RRIGLVDELLAPNEAAVRLLALVDGLREQTGRPRRRFWRVARRVLGRLLMPALTVPGGGRTGPGFADPAAELRRAVVAGLRSEGEGFAAERAAFTRLAMADETRHRLDLHRHATGPVRVFPEPVNPV